MANQPEIYNLGSDNGLGNAWPLLAMGNNGGFLGGGLGSGFIGGIFGGLLSNVFGWGNGMGGMNGGAAALGAQATANNNTDLIVQAVTAQGEQARQATQTLSTMLGQDYTQLSNQLGIVNTTLGQMAIQNATTPLQIINAINAGNTALQSQFCQCCCENKLAIANQTNDLQRSMDGINQNISATRAAQQLSDCQQTYALTDTMNRNYQLLDNKIDMLESQRKDREITALTAENATLKSQNFSTNLMGQALAPVNAQLAKLTSDIDDIKCKLPNTVNVEYPNLQVFNATPYVSGGFYGQNPNFGFNGWGFNGFNGYF